MQYFAWLKTVFYQELLCKDEVGAQIFYRLVYGNPWIPRVWDIFHIRMILLFS